MRCDTLEVTLEMRRIAWQPQGPGTITLPAYAFVEPGQPARIPGPLLRLKETQWLRLTIRNRVAVDVVVRGLGARPFAASGADSTLVRVASDATVLVRAGAPGSYFYWGRVTPAVLPAHLSPPIPPQLLSAAGGEGPEGVFVGPLIVDGATETPDPRERTVLITRWMDDTIPGVSDPTDWMFMFNGASYPNIPPMRYAVGDTVRWRVINANLASHPLHLHGFHFRVRERGDNDGRSAGRPFTARTAVTELLRGGESMRITWVPDRAGNWLFHCHLLRHMSRHQQLPRTSEDPAHEPHHAPTGAVRDGAHAMAGLVWPVEVHGAPGTDSVAAEARAAGRGARPAYRRTIRLYANERVGSTDTVTRFAFIAQRGGRAPARDSLELPSTTLVLTRGEPVRIRVVNRMRVPLAVHWHGIELESVYDGVAHMSGMGPVVRPPIAPGDSADVFFTPRRAGTFLYHTHDEPGGELAGGLYGALLVVDGPPSREAVRDPLVLIGTHASSARGRVAINGRTEPAPIVLHGDGGERLRIASITSDELVQVRLLRGDSVTTWRVLARDGAEVSPDAQRDEPALTWMSAGMTMDVAIAPPRPDERLALRIRMRAYESYPSGGSEVAVPLLWR
jgi:FtsP/CotA-like multicopper oxidase with cupredoxin domain